jgi:signal transduction histidine kinase
MDFNSWKLRLQKIIKCWLDQPFNALHLRLLLSYLSVMSTVLVIMIVFVYQYFANNLYNKFDRQMATLVDAASHSLPRLKANPNLAHSAEQRDRTFDNDGDLDIPWQDISQHQQTVEWFDVDGKLLVQTGKKIPNFPLVTSVKPSKVQQLENSPEGDTNDAYEDLRSLTVPVYRVNATNESISNQEPSQKILIGYVRVTESSQELEEELEKLLLAFGWGGLLAIALSSVGGWWFVKQTLRPIEQNYEQMRQFTADASHELRSPLTAIKTSVDVIRSHPERVHNADIQKIAAIAQASEQMTHLVEDLLFMARFDNGRDRDRQDLLFSPSELLEDLLAMLEPQIQTKEIGLRTNLHESKLHELDQANIYGDPQQVRRLFVNLLENAIAYTPQSGEIQVNLAKHEGFLEIDITDTGIGIAAEDLDHIFERFWRADRARNRRSGGSGLGLSIAQAIAYRHGAVINVSSAIGLGSCFSVKFPCDRQL